jgi:quinohemoprotein ethanol dehydrogenase
MNTKPLIRAAGAAVLILAAAAMPHAQQPAQVDDAALKKAPAGENWLTYGLDQSETRFSPLADINATNVKELGLSWAYDVGRGGGGQEATPIVANGVIYGITNWSIVFAVDARTGKEKWRWDPWVNQDATRSAICCGVVNRGLAIYKGLVFAPIIDGRLQALDAGTGKVVWEARIAYPQDYYTVTMAPRIAKGKVIIGASGGDRTTRGFFDAYDAMTGRRVWRFWTVPGDPAKGFENAAMKKAAATWDVEQEWWTKGGGGAVWDGIAFDAEAGLVYAGTGNAEPWTYHLRSAKEKENLYACSIVAVDVDTGELKWHYQVVPGDNWDFDSVQQLTLANLRINGRERKVIMQANKNGFYYVIDRITGQFISAQPFGYVTWAKGIDQKTGKPMVNPEAFYGTDAIRISPGGGGAHNWSPMSYNPIAGLTYIPTSTNNSFVYAAETKFDPRPGVAPGTVQMTGTVRPAPEPKLPPPPAIGPQPIEGPGNRGALVAWDPVAQTMKWRMPGGGGIGGGTMTTAGNLVFQVLADGRLMAYTADKGEKLLELQTGLRSGMGPPITYKLDGKQYVALMGGVGQTAPGGNAGPGNQATPFTPKLLVFEIGGKATLPGPTTSSQ